MKSVLTAPSLNLSGNRPLSSMEYGGGDKMPPNWPGSFCFFAPWKLATMKEVALWYQHAKENSHTEKAVASHTKWREMTRNPRW